MAQRLALLLILALFTACLTGCETVSVGLTYAGQYGDYTVKRAVTNGQGQWDVLIAADGKRIIPLHK